MLATGSRISQHLRLRDYDVHFGLGFSAIAIASSSSSSSQNLSYRSPLRRPISFSCSIFPSTSPGEFPFLSDSLSSREDDLEVSSEGLSPVSGGIVALGKFDALHVGHRELAIQASKVGPPFLLSFVGIAEVLGWEPRAPIVAQCDRKRVLSSWAPYCRNSAPSEFQIEFSSVRYLTPREFVEKLSKELGVHGVVAGESYRFGYKAAGDATELVTLCEEYGLGAYIIKSVMDESQKVVDSANSKERGQVSSTRVLYALSVGNMKYVSELLGRRHRLVLTTNGLEGFSSSSSSSRVSAPKSCLLNLAPKEGLYNKCFVCTIDENLIPCRVVIDSTHVHIEVDQIDACHTVGTQDYLYVEFGDEGA